MISPSVSAIWDRLQIELQCCGVNSYEDWYFIENWPREKWVPRSCCISRYSISTEIYEGSGSTDDKECYK
jgi:tetraspanin-9